MVGLLSKTLPTLSTGYLNYSGSAWQFSSLPTPTVTSIVAGTNTSVSNSSGAWTVNATNQIPTGTGLLVVNSGTASASTMSGDATFVASTGVITLKNTGPGVTSTVGNATTVPIISIDAQGRVTALTSTTITQPSVPVTSVVAGTNTSVTNSSGAWTVNNTYVSPVTSVVAGTGTTVTNSSGAWTVNASTNVTDITTAITFDKSNSTPNINQTGLTSDVLPQNLTITAQRAYTSATTNVAGGSLILQGGISSGSKPGAFITLNGGYGSITEAYAYIGAEMTTFETSSGSQRLVIDNMNNAISSPTTYTIGTSTSPFTNTYTTSLTLGGHNIPAPSGTNTVLSYNGTTASWSSVSSSFTAAGDLSGSASSQEVVGLLSMPLPTTGSGDLEWTGSAWAFHTPTVASLSAGSGISVSNSSGTWTISNTYTSPVTSVVAGTNTSVSNSSGAWTINAANQIPTGTGLLVVNGGTASASTMSGDATFVASTGVITLKNTGPGVTSTVGNATTVPIISIDSQGRVTALTSTTITQPSVPVTSIVAGTNTSVSNSSGAWTVNNTYVSPVTSVVAGTLISSVSNASGAWTVNATNQIPTGTGLLVVNSGIASASTMSGDATLNTSTGALTLKNTGPGVTSTVGNATTVPIISIDAQGRVTSLTSTTITQPSVPVTSIVAGTNTSVSSASGAWTVNNTYVSPVTSVVAGTNTTVSNVGGAWTVNATQPTSLTVGGDISGTTASATVTKLDGYSLPTLTGSGNLNWNGSSWVLMSNLITNTHTNIITASYTVNSGSTPDKVVLCNASAPITVTLPLSPNAGDTYKVKDKSGAANTNNITVSGNGNNIDGATSFVMNRNYQSAELIYDGSVWNIL